LSQLLSKVTVTSCSFYIKCSIWRLAAERRTRKICRHRSRHAEKSSFSVDANTITKFLPIVTVKKSLKIGGGRWNRETWHREAWHRETWQDGTRLNSTI